MTDVNKRLADILAEYSDAMSVIEHSATQAEAGEAQGCATILKPADQQRRWRPPTIRA